MTVSSDTPTVIARVKAPRRVLPALLASAALVLGLLTAVGVWLLGSESGNAWLIARVPGVSVTDLSGRLMGGPLAVARIEAQVGDRKLRIERLSWQDARWQWRPHEGAWIGLTLVEARVERIDVGGTAAQPTAPTAPTSLRLPIALTLQGARIGALYIDGQAPLTALSTSLELGARGGAEHRVSALAFTWDRLQLQGQTTLATDAPFALDTQVDLRSREGSTPPWQAKVGARGPLATLTVQAQLSSAQARGATLRAQATLQPFAAWPLAALAATTQDLDLASLGSGLPTTRLSGRADIDTRGLDAPISVRLALANAVPGRWDQQRLPITALDLELGGRAGDRLRLRVQRLALQLAGGAGRIDGSGEWHNDAASLVLRLQALRPAALDQRAVAMTVAGSVNLQLSGLPSPDGTRAAAPRQQAQARLALEGRLDARSQLPLQIKATADGERSGAAWHVDLSEFDARSGAAHAQAALRAERKADGSWLLTSRGELSGVDPAPWLPPGKEVSGWRQGPHRLAGRWSADLQAGTGIADAQPDVASLLAVRGQAEFEVFESVLAGVPLQGRVVLNGRTPGWSVEADLRTADNHIALKGRLAPRAADDRWRADVDAPALAVLPPLLRLHPTIAALLGTPTGRAALTGKVAGHWQAQGRWPAVASSGTLQADALQAGRLRAARLQTQWQAGPDANAVLALQFDGERITFDTLRADTLQARVDGSLTAHRITLDVTSPLRPPAWTDNLLGMAPTGSRLQLRAAGQWLAANPASDPLAGRWRGQSIELDARGLGGKAATNAPWLQARDLRAQLQLDANGQARDLSLDPGRIDLLGAALRWTQASWRKASTHAPAQAALEAELEPLAVAPWLARLQPDGGWGGQLTLAARASVRLSDRVSADVVLERHAGDLTLTDVTGTQSLGLTDLRLAINAQDGTWHFTQAVAGTNLGVLAGAQSLRVPAQATWPSPDTPMQGVLEWRVADLGAWTPFTPPGWRLSGAMRTSAALGGRFGAPEVQGKVEGSGLGVRNILEGVDVRDGELTLSLRGSEAKVDRFVFKGGAGELRLTGGASLGAEPSAKLRLVAERFQLLGRFDRRIVASGNAELALAAKSLQLDGRFRVDEGLFDFTRGDAPSLDSDVQVQGGRFAKAQAEAEAQAEAASERAAAREAAPRAVRVALQIDLGEALKLRGRGLDTQLRGNLVVSAPAGRVAVNGSVRTEAGNYAAYGQKLSIERGVLVFIGAAENPRLDVVAVRPGLEVRVGVQVGGTAQNPRVRLFSEPEMSDTDKLSWLVLGRAPDGLARNDTALLQRAALALLAGEGGGLDNPLLANLGLDEFSVRQKESGEVRDTVVTLGKQLSQRWYVGYERGVNSTAGTWQLIYRVAQRFTLRAQAGDDNALDAIWSWRWN